MKILIASTNAGKIEGARKAFSRYFDDFEIIGINVSSDVPEMPVNNEIILGAKNRIKNLKDYAVKNDINADLYISVESGIQNLFGEWMITTITGMEDNDSFKSYSSSASFPVPKKYVDEVIKFGLNLVMDKLFGEDKQRHNHKGSIQLLTKNEITRIDLTEEAFIMACTKYINKGVWND